jgi:hypothetical protein
VTIFCTTTFFFGEIIRAINLIYNPHIYFFPSNTKGYKVGLSSQFIFFGGGGGGGGGGGVLIFVGGVCFFLI